MSDNVILDNAKRVLPSKSSGNGAGKISWPDPIESKAYYGLAGDIVHIIEPHTEADPAALLVQFLTVFGNILGRGPHFKAEADEHHLNIFSCLVGETAKGRKGSSLGYVLNIFQKIDESWNRCLQSGLSSGEGLIWAVRDEIVKTEPIRNNKKEITSYQDLVVDQGVEDKRAMVIQSELAATLRILGRDGNTLSAILRDAWDGRDLRIMTKNSPAESTQPHISIIGHITKSELTRYLTSTESDNGFANRFLWVCVKRSKLLPEGGKLGDTEKFDAVFNPLTLKLKEVVEFARGIHEIQRDDNARILWREIYSQLSEGRTGLFGAVTARAEAQTMRLACLYALLDSSPTIRLEHLSAGLALWAYCEESAKYIFGETLGDPLADEIKRVLDDEPKGMTQTELSNHFKRHKRAEQLKRALNLLIARGTVFKVAEETSGRTSHRYFSSQNYRRNN